MYARMLQHINTYYMYDTHTCVHIGNRHICTHANYYIYMHTQIYIYTFIYRHICRHVYYYIYTHAQIYMYTLIYRHICTHAYYYIYMHAQIYIYTFMSYTFNSTKNITEVVICGVK